MANGVVFDQGMTGNSVGFAAMNAVMFLRGRPVELSDYHLYSVMNPEDDPMSDGPTPRRTEEIMMTLNDDVFMGSDVDRVAALIKSPDHTITLVPKRTHHKGTMGPNVLSVLNHALFSRVEKYKSADGNRARRRKGRITPR